MTQKPLRSCNKKYWKREMSHKSLCVSTWLTCSSPPTACECTGTVERLFTSNIRRSYRSAKIFTSTRATPCGRILLNYRMTKWKERGRNWLWHTEYESVVITPTLWRRVTRCCVNRASEDMLKTGEKENALYQTARRAAICTKFHTALCQ